MRRCLTAGLLVLVVSATGCSVTAPSAQSLPGSGGVDDPTPVGVVDPTATVGERDETPQPSTTLSALLVPPPSDGGTAPSPVELSAYQKGVLADGEVTFEEYEASVLAHLACLQDAGIRTTGPKSAHAGLMLSWTLNPPQGMSEDEFFAAESACLAEYLSVVETAWMEAARPDEKTMVEYAAKLTECLNEAGADLEAGLTEIEILNSVLGANPHWDLPFNKVEPCLQAYAFSVSD